MSAFGFVEWFRPGDRDHVEAALAGMTATGATRLRTHLSWAEYHMPGGEEWFDWLIPRLAQEVELLPCLHYTPPSLSRTGRSSGPPKRLKDFADFVDVVLTRHGAHFEHVELWNEPNNLLDWDWRVDPDADLFCEMIGMAAHWIRHRGWKPVLGGPSPFDPVWLDLMGQRGLIGLMHAVGIHGFPGTWDSEAGSWAGWETHLSEMRAILDRYNPDAEIWITETGYSTWRHDEIEQARRFLTALDASADRMYWYGWSDLPQETATQEGLQFDPRHYHLGAASAGGRPKLLARLLSAGGVPRVREVADFPTPCIASGARHALVTGGAGFVGSNLVESLASEGREVLVLDNLSRPGVEENLAALSARHPGRVHPLPADLRDGAALAAAVREADEIHHLAAQTAVTTSLAAPVEDFEVNARGTLDLLEAIRATGRKIPLLFASTNKVYGNLADVAISDGDEACAPADAAFANGIPESAPLDFRTPYGCSKGVADQYVLDYARGYGLPAAVFRMSCIYGPRQFGTEDQGWVAHFLLSALTGRPVTVYGSGRQVRDICEVSDAVRAYRMAMARFGSVNGRAFNLGGGPANAVSLRQVIDEIGRITGAPMRVEGADWRQGDQSWFVADTSALRHATGWSPKVGWRAGLRRLVAWFEEHRMPASERRATA